MISPAWRLRSSLSRTSGSVACTEMYSGLTLRRMILSSSWREMFVIVM